MRMSEIAIDGQSPIESYGAGGFRLRGEMRPGSLILLPTGSVAWAVVESTGVTPEVLSPVLQAAAQIDVLLIGMGEQIAPIPVAVRDLLDEAEVGVETMSTPSACRTYNVLLAEGRRVAAALIAI